MMQISNTIVFKYNAKCILQDNAHAYKIMKLF